MKFTPICSRRFLRSLVPLVCLLWFVAGGGSRNSGVGVADLLEGELDRRGLAVCERRSIALVLSEHRLSASGQTAGAAEVIHRRLPAVGYLLRRTVETPREPVNPFPRQTFSTLRVPSSSLASAVG